jgi:hypothetical protein
VLGLDVKKPEIGYDEQADVLYVSIGCPVPSVSEEDHEVEGVHYRYSLETRILLGATILLYSRQDKAELRKRLPFLVSLP